MEVVMTLWTVLSVFYYWQKHLAKRKETAMLEIAKRSLDDDDHKWKDVA